MIGERALSVLLSLSGVIGCTGGSDRSMPEATPSVTTTSAPRPRPPGTGDESGRDAVSGQAGSTPSATSSARPTDAAVPASASAAVASAPAVPLGPRCAAAGSAKPVLLATHPSELRDLVVDPAGLFALGRLDPSADRWAVYRVAKDGGGVTMLTTLTTLTYSAHLAVDPTGIYLSQQLRGENAGGAALVRIAREGGAPEIVAERFGWLGGVHQGFAYGVDYVPRAGTEAVVRVPTKGGEVQVLFQRKIKRDGYATGAFRFNDIAVDGDGVFLADSGEGAIVRVPLEGGSPERLLDEVQSPCCLHLNRKRVFFSATFDYGAGPSVPKAGGDGYDYRWQGKRSAAGGSWALAPDGDQVIALGLDDRGRRRMTVVGADMATIHSVPLEHIEQRHAVADEECVYYVRVDPSGVSWFNAVAKPAAGP